MTRSEGGRGFQGTRVLVTGGAGFVGSHLCEALVAAGAAVTVLDDLSAGRAANLEACRGARGFDLRVGSACDPELVDGLVREAELVFHLAAAVGVQRVWAAPEATLRDGVRATRLVLDAAVRHGARVVFASSSEVYGPAARVPLREEAPLLVGASDSRRWSYACSKAMGEWLAAAHARANGLEALCVRLFNVVGPRQLAGGGMVVPRFVGQALRGEPLTVYGDGRQTRTFLDVRDATRGLLALASPDGPREGTFNLGGDEETSVLALARLVREAAGGTAPIVRMPYREAFGLGFQEASRRRPDLARLRAATGFRPRRRLRDTLDELVRSGRAPRPGTLAPPGPRPADAVGA